MQNESRKTQNSLHQLVQVVACFALLVTFAFCFGACGKSPESEQNSKPMSKEEIKAKIMEKDVQPSAEALARKEKSIAKLNQQKIPVIQHLPVIEDSNTAKKRTKEEIAHRAIALCIVAVKGEGLDQVTVEGLVKRYDAQSFFTPGEEKFIKNPTPAQKDRIKFSWQYEDYWVMLWALGYIDTLDYPNKACDVQKAVKFFHDNSTEEFMAKANLRSLSEILDEADLIYRYDWAVVNARVKKQDAPVGLDEGVVTERHYALNWLIGYMDQDWDDVTTDT